MFRTPFFLPGLYPTLTWKIATDKKEIYLTFDDGPVPGPTEFVLDQLAKFHAKATFFCIGDNVRKHPDLFRKIAAEGHRLGNHTFNHVKGWSTSTQDYVGNTEKCRQEMVTHGFIPIAQQPLLFRPPYGRIKRSQIKALSDYRIIMWDVLTSDYAPSLSPEKCLKGSIKAVRPGSIIVMHDSLKAERNLTFALPGLLKYFTERGFGFKCL